MKDESLQSGTLSFCVQKAPASEAVEAAERCALTGSLLLWSRKFASSPKSPPPLEFYG